MGVFDDKKFESLDWISQAIEPIESELNVILGNVPDETILDIEKIIEFTSKSYSLSLSLDDIIFALINKHNPHFKTLSWQELDTLKKCFHIEIVGNPIINFVNMSITGGYIKIVKKISTLDEKDLKALLGICGIASVKNCNYPSDAASRFNEIFRLLDKCDKGLRSKSLHKKKIYLCNRLIQLFETNEWNIKDTTLANKVGYWITQYIKDGNMVAMVNLCKLKVMTHKGRPIYSMEEIE